MSPPHCPCQAEARGPRHLRVLPPSNLLLCGLGAPSMGSRLALPSASRGPDSKTRPETTHGPSCFENVLSTCCVSGPLHWHRLQRTCPAPNKLQVRWALLSASEEVLSPSRLPAAPAGSVRQPGVRAGSQSHGLSWAGQSGHSVSSCTAVPAHWGVCSPHFTEDTHLETSPAPCPRSYDRTAVQTCVCRIHEGEPVLASSIGG